MKNLLRLTLPLLVAGLSIVPLRAQTIGAQAEFDGEILTRGPVHEAFAAVVTYNPEAGLIVDRPPPEPIEEMPPEERPVDADTAWIPGYWGWDDERGDYIWISGTWRVLPPGRAWIAGYWRDSGRGWQWVSGYWADAARREVTYLEPPPETLEEGPSSPPPSDNFEWVPGYWEWRGGRYLWRPGYWIEGRVDWVWVPSYYVWTPRGYVFIEGYWDYAPAERGLLFAPVYYADYRRPRSYYRPSIVLNVAILSDYLFLRPRYSHYYFGDYYDSRYETSGIYATFSFHTSRRGYDPFYTYSRWRHRDDRDWERRYRESYDYRRSHVDARPPRRWTGSNITVNVNQNITQIGGAGSRQTVTYAQPIQQYAQVADAPIRVERSTTRNFDQQVQVARQVQEQRVQRRTLESQQGATSASVESGTTSRQIGAPAREQTVMGQQSAAVAMPTSPIVAREGAGGRQPPPPRAESPQRGGRQARQADQPGSPNLTEVQAGQAPVSRREAVESPAERQARQQGVIGANPSSRPAPARGPDRGLRADNSAALEAQRLDEQAREQERRQAEEAGRRNAAQPGAIGAEPRPIPGQPSPLQGYERPDQAREQAEQQRRAGEAQERAWQQSQQGQGVREDQQRREQERQEQQRARQQEADARQQQRESEFQAREQQGRAAEQVRDQQSWAAEQQRAQQAQAAQQSRAAEEQRARQSQAAEHAQAEQQSRAADQAREQQSRAAEQARERQAQAAEQARGQERQAVEQQRAQQAQADQKAREQQRAAEQPAREQQVRPAQAPERVEQKVAPPRDQKQPPPRKSKEEEEEERKKGKRGG